MYNSHLLLVFGETTYMNIPKKWHEVYPYGTKEGDEEAKVFRALSRDSKYEYRAIPAIVKSTGLSRERVEEVIDKYATQYDPPLIHAHPSQEDHWGYWERCVDDLKKDDKSITNQDKDNRINKHLDAIQSYWKPDAVV